MRGIIFGSFVVLGIGYWLYGNPDITLRSSDGKWADEEFLSKGRSFDAIVWNFEGYKLKCFAYNAVPLRATTENWFNLFAWPSYLSDAKWRIQYSNSHHEIGDYYPPVTDTRNCYNSLWSREIVKRTDIAAAQYLKKLRASEY